MSKGYFITGTNTNIGKTVAAAKMVASLTAHYFKPIQTGATDDDDSKTVYNFTKCSFTAPVYSFDTPSSPHYAARKAKAEIDINKINLPIINKPIIVEGAGGIMVPLTNNIYMTDLIKKFDLPAIIVCAGALGTLNHTLLTVKVLRDAQIEIAGLIINGKIELDNDRELANFTGLPILYKIPQLQNEKELRDYIQFNKLPQ